MTEIWYDLLLMAHTYSLTVCQIHVHRQGGCIVNTTRERLITLPFFFFFFGGGGVGAVNVCISKYLEFVNVLFLWFICSDLFPCSDCFFFVQAHIYTVCVFISIRLHIFPQVRRNSCTTVCSPSRKIIHEL